MPGRFEAAKDGSVPNFGKRQGARWESPQIPKIWDVPVKDCLFVKLRFVPILQRVTIFALFEWNADKRR